MTKNEIVWKVVKSLLEIADGSYTSNPLTQIAAAEALVRLLPFVSSKEPVVVSENEVP